MHEQSFFHFPFPFHAMLRVAINGYGRIGRNVHRQFVNRFPDTGQVVAINASSDADMRAYLLKYDSLHGRFDAAVCADDDHMRVNGTEVTVVKEREPARCPWKDLGVDIVIEATGNFRTSEKARPHLQAGAKKIGRASGRERGEMSVVA